ncbi:hypothetical protein ACIQPQ_34345 [Streptomyces sp. NPDC091281]|uniref:hypothetical protein n=1 Tax=Streptomyces sp. NPDC091281 TaxID=3365985 RepID=UPI0038047246
MRLSDAKAQVERDQPELTGTAKIEAIKALRARADARETKGSPTDGLPRCGRCEQFVIPRRQGGAAGALNVLALCQLAAVVAAIWAVAGQFEPSGAGLVAVLVVWPALIDPAWLGLVAAVVALLVVAGLAGAAGERAKQRAVCPHCDAPMADVIGE